MALSNDLVQEFASVLSSTNEPKVTTTCYGKVTRMESSTSGFVTLDGAEGGETPAVFTVAAHVNDRVLMMLKNRTAVVIGNITHPVLMTGTVHASDGIIVEGYLTTNPARTTYNDTEHSGLTFSSDGIGAIDTSPGGGSWYLRTNGTFQFGGSNGITFANSKVELGSNVTLYANYIKGTKSFGDWSLNFETGELTIGTINVNKLQGTIGDPNGTGPYIDFGNKTMSIGSISASDITSGTLNVNYIAPIPNSKLSGSASGSAYSGATAWSIDFNTGVISIGDISATSIKAGYISVDRIQGNSIPNSKLSGSASGSAYSGATAWGIDFNTGVISIGDISATNIKTGTLTVGGSATNTVGSIVIKAANDTEIGRWSNAGISIKSGTITLGTYGSDGSVCLSSANLGSATIAGKTGLSDWRLTVGTKMGVTSSGALYATGVTVSGVLSAGPNSTIGPWSVTDSAIWYGVPNAGVTAANAFKHASGLYFGTSGLSVKDKFYVDSNGIPYCNGASLYINSAPAVGSDSSGIAIQISNAIKGEIYVTRSSSTAYDMAVESYGGLALLGPTWLTLEAPTVTTWGNVKITEGKNIYLVGTGSDPGDLIFLDSSEIEMGRIWNNNNTMYFRAGPSGTDFVVGQSTNYSYNTILVGASKSNYYSQPGVSVMSNGNITLTYDGGGAGLYFAYNKAAAYTVGLYEAASGNLTCTGELFSNNTIRAGYDTLNAAMAVQVMNSKNKIGLRVDADGNCGIYYYNYNSHSAKWLLKFDVNGNQV